ncbi:MAG TPA: tRNA uridine(34) 5-carboxymethylaminomethyl modification radical SAM/GNAT enzyme Elp3 [Patescibacteria group bacterium]
MKKILAQITQDLIEAKPANRQDLLKIVRRGAGKFKIDQPRNSSLLKTYHTLLKNKTIEADKNLEGLLKKAEIRTLSGVAPITVLTKPAGCRNACVYCPTEARMPKSYLSNEPAVMRAILSKWDPYVQMKVRIRALKENGHATDKLEVIVIGGTWSYHQRNYQNWYIKRLYDGANSSPLLPYDAPFQKEKGARTLAEAQKINETADNRIIGLTLETRPNCITPQELRRFRKFGCTKVEMGVQHLDNKVLKLINRGHDVEESIRATKLLKDAGFKICYHMMPGLPGSTPEKDVENFKTLFSDQRFQPDMLKVYPTAVTKNAVLYKWLQEGKYKPYTKEERFEMLLQIKEAVPYHCRIIRLIRDIPSVSIVAGNKVTNLREMLQQQLASQGKSCKCIRCREARNRTTNLNEAVLVTRKYQASDGIEYFISYESRDNKILYAFVRLRIPSHVPQNKPDDSELLKLLPDLKGAALIRELHTYGKLVPLTSEKSEAVQHAGFGRRLMAEAERIVKDLGIKKIAVISGIGVRGYYEKLGYEVEDTYMTKEIT